MRPITHIINRRRFLKRGALFIPATCGIRRALAQSLNLADGPFLSGSASAPLDPSATDWSARVVANGGAAPSGATVRAVSNFAISIKAASLDTKIVSVLMMAPDSLIAATTPIFKTAGNDPWTNHNFLGADLTVNGLLGNGSTKYLDTGIIPFSSGLVSTSAGLVVYVSVDDATTTQGELSVYGAGFQSNFGLYPHYGTTHSGFFCWRFTGPGTDSLADWTVPSPATGFYSGQRTAANAIAAYFANSTHAHAALATGAGAQAGVVESIQPIYAFAANNNGGGPADFSKKRVSFLAVTKGLSAADSANLYTPTQALRTAFGGGFV